jgi:hypothetical protein
MPPRHDPAGRPLTQDPTPALATMDMDEVHMSNAGLLSGLGQIVRFMF